ncbi:MAG TPA: alpha/beta hydrolase [Aeromicrobium sp.]|nr:alpha/beta hydrolase [Aeromicrobium sp.]
MKRFLILLVSIGLVIGIGAAGFAIYRSNSTGPDPKPTAENPPAGLARFYAQDLKWTKCDDDVCTKVKVPIDYEKPTGDTIELALRRVRATGAGGSVIFTNPGGPGGSATDFVNYVASSVSDEIRKTYDIVGLDPRGVGESSPMECLSDADFDAFIDIDPDPDNDEEIAAVRDSVRNMGKACARNSGALAGHVSTEETARDHDIVRALLGQKKMIWLGFSYGTQLGATYAELFPEKVGRMVLDGSVDVTLDSIGQGLGQAEGFQLALESYLKNCLDEDVCPVGDSVANASANIAKMLAALDANPITVPSGRKLTVGRAFYGIAMSLYSRESWDYLTTALEGLAKGDGRVMLILSDAYFERKPDGSFADNSGQAIYAINCMDTDDAPNLAETQAVLPAFRKASPVFGAALGWGVMACNDWPIKAPHPQQAVKAAGTSPILVVGTTKDPATPYKWSEAMAEQLESGVLLTREGDGHTAYLSGNKCIQAAVDKYLLTGVAPDDGTVCGE